MLPENQQFGNASEDGSHAVKDQQVVHDNSQTGGDQQTDAAHNRQTLGDQDTLDSSVIGDQTGQAMQANDTDRNESQELKDQQANDAAQDRHTDKCSCISCWSANKAEDRSRNTKLADARERTPRFLFRGWDNISNDISGGHRNLNTPDAVTPLAYSKHAESEVTSIFDQSETALRNMVLNHLTVYGPDPSKPPTQFSSWASTITGAFRFAEDTETPYVSVIDTVMLAGSNYVAHVPALEFLDPDCREYHWEYLVHGVVEGCYYVALPMTHFTRIDFPDKPAWGALPFTPGLTESLDLPEQTNAESTQMLRQALKIAKLYGSHFSLAIFLAITCQKLKHPRYCNDRECTRKEIQKLVFFTDSHKLRVPFEWCAERSIMVDGVVDTWAYEEVQAMLLCMRLLVMQRYPREVKKRWPQLKREDVFRYGMMVAETKRNEDCERGS